MNPLFKYPRTPHIKGSGLQSGDEDLKTVSFEDLKASHLIVEEKMDGANCGISFTPSGELQLQSRGHYLTGGPRERQFQLFKTWANRYAADMWAQLGDRYVLYGEWLYAKHTVYYDELPHYFMEFDILDTHNQSFLSTSRRKDFLQDLPFIYSVHVLHEGKVSSEKVLRDQVGASRFISDYQEKHLRQEAIQCGLSAEKALRETDTTGLMEGLYIKLEQNGVVTGRYKFVRPGFLQTILESGSHWLNRPIIPNRLRKGVTLFE